jgi:tetratricopeptide (TPR) repeat protein
MKHFFLLKTFIISLFFFTDVIAKESDHFLKAKKYFVNEEFEKSKFFFEKDLVFNPKHEDSYLYLAKIFNKNKNLKEQEINLNTVLLLNPNNDEALYMLTLLNIKQSNYKKANELIDKFILICDKFCSKKSEIQEKLKKLTPSNAEDNN